MPQRWLVKTEPTDYAAEDLERDGTTDWTGVKNPTAQQHLRAMKAGDDVLVYHTGNVKAIVATATVERGPAPDPGDPAGKRVQVTLAFGGWLKTPVTLKQIKADERFADFDLVRMSRLSVMPVDGATWKALLGLAGGPRK